MNDPTDPPLPQNLDYYAILNLTPRKQDPTLTPSEVKAAYKRALLQHHPDKKNNNKGPATSLSTNPTSTTTSNPPSSSPNFSQETNPNPITIDSIALAYKILSSPHLKASYDIGLQTSGSTSGEEERDRVFRTGLETVDLDDLDFEEEGLEASGPTLAPPPPPSSPPPSPCWTRSCRCGDDKGFVVTEGELEAMADEGEGEIIIGCRGCSLWLRVLFGVEEEG